MKFLQAMLIASLAITVASQAMDKDSKKPASFQKVTSSGKAKKSQRSPERTAKSGTSTPELAKIINVVLSVQKQNNTLRESQRSTAELLQQIISSNKALSLELKQTQETVEKQQVQIGLLCALLKSTCQDLLPSSLLAEDAELDVELKPSTGMPLPLVSEFKPTRVLAWQGSLEAPADNQLFDSPNHPRLPSMPCGQNPWLSPNHTKK